MSLLNNYIIKMEEEFTHSQYPFLKELGIGEENNGCYDGKDWSGNGETLISFNPANGKVLILFYSLLENSKN